MSMMLIGLAIIAGLVAMVVLPWVNLAKIGALRTSHQALEARMRMLLAHLEKHGVPIPPELQFPVEEWAWQREARERAEATGIMTTPPPTPTPAVVTVATPSAPIPTPAPRAARSFEQQFGARLPVWIGGIALALAGLFLVKYSIESGLLSPVVRVMLGLIFGAGLLQVAARIREREGIANGARIAQALSGAGIADLYFCIFAATSLYEFVPSFIGFIGMAGVTATAVILSLRHGAPIAMLGLIGGFLTPAVIGSVDPSAPLLFLYLYAVLAGLLVVIRREGWWFMATPAVLASFGWAVLWLFGADMGPYDSFWLGLFILGISATVVATSQLDAVRGVASDTPPLTGSLQYLTLGTAVILMGTVAGQAGFGGLEWSLFAVLTLGGIALARFKQATYGFVPWLAMAVHMVMVVFYALKTGMWQGIDAPALAIIITGFAGLFITSGYYLQSRSERPLLWSGLVAGAAIGYYLLGYALLKDTQLFAGVTYFWGGLAIAIALVTIHVLRCLIADIPEDHAQRGHVLSLYAALATTFVTFGLTIELPREFLSVAVAAQVLALAWINTHTRIGGLRRIAAVLGVVFAGLLIPQMLLLVQLTAYSLAEMELALQQGVPIVDWPVFQLGLPALFFVMAAYLLRLESDGRVVRALEVGAIALIAVMGYYLTRHAFHVDAEVLFKKAGFFERGVITNVLFIYGIGCLYLGRRYGRCAVGLSGLGLSLVALFRIVYFDLIVYNPLWSSQQEVGEAILFNALIITYGLPLIWSYRLVTEARAMGKPAIARYVSAAMLVIAFALVTLEVCQIFHGNLLSGSTSSNAEVYSYSVAWLLFGLALLLLGTWRDAKQVRIASLLVMILTVGKVFLYDAAELEGLFRVFSFFGLGLSLLGLSWFYTRYVFGARTGEVK